MIKSVGTPPPSLGERVTGQTWDERKATGKFGPFDEALWPKSKNDPVKVELPVNSTQFPTALRSFHEEQVKRNQGTFLPSSGTAASKARRKGYRPVKKGSPAP